MTVLEFNRWFLALFFTGVAVFYVCRIFLLSHKLKTDVTYGGQPGTLHQATHQAFKIFRAFILGVCVARVVYPNLDRFLIPIPALQNPVFLLTGDAMLLGGFFAIAAINIYMNGAWRSGVRREDDVKLITTGPFAWSQNPMMLFVLIGQVGFFLALPSVFSLVCLGVGVWAVIAQVQVEKEALSEKFGRTYADYAQTTPQWLIFK